MIWLSRMIQIFGRMKQKIGRHWRTSAPTSTVGRSYRPVEVVSSPINAVDRRMKRLEKRISKLEQLQQ